MLSNKAKKYIQRNYRNETDRKLAKRFQVSTDEIISFRTEDKLYRGQFDVAVFDIGRRRLITNIGIGSGLALILGGGGYTLYENLNKEDNKHLRKSDIEVGNPIKLEDVPQYLNQFHSNFGSVKEEHFAENQKGFVFLIPQIHGTKRDSKFTPPDAYTDAITSQYNIFRQLTELVNDGITTMFSEGIGYKPKIKEPKEGSREISNTLAKVFHYSVEDLQNPNNMYQRYRAIEDFYQIASVGNAGKFGISADDAVVYVFQDKINLQRAENESTLKQGFALLDNLAKETEQLSYDYELQGIRDSQLRNQGFMTLNGEYWPKIKELVIDKRSIETVGIISDYFTTGNEKVVSTIWGGLHIPKMRDELKKNDISYVLLTPKNLENMDFNQEPTIDSFFRYR
ncbi:MAG: hypothetical protein AABY14_03390 [Nanoarchaeota archaeon]